MLEGEHGEKGGSTNLAFDDEISRGNGADVFSEAVLDS